MPRNGETSVFRISDLSDKDIWDIGDNIVAVALKKPILGRGDIKAAIVIRNHLKVVPNEPPPRHANIINWPDEKQKQKLIALDLAAEAEFIKNNSKT